MHLFIFKKIKTITEGTELAGQTVQDISISCGIRKKLGATFPLPFPSHQEQDNIH